MKTLSLADKIDALLPQTQCQRCGYPACRPYAEAIAKGEAEINQCPPGGAAGIQRLATLLGRDSLPLSPAHGVEMGKQVVKIDENLCIGCTLCLQACPVDAIVGASKLMHTVIADHCTGCELCIPVCPVDCIGIVPLAPPRPYDEREGCAMTTKEQAAAEAARARYEFHRFRLERDKRERAERLAAKSSASAAADAEAARKKALIAAAIARVRQATPKPDHE